MRVLVAVGCAVIVLNGCGDTEEEPAGVVPQHQLDALHEAEAVDQMLEDAEARRRKQIDENG